MNPGRIVANIMPQDVMIVFAVSVVLILLIVWKGNRNEKD